MRWLSNTIFSFWNLSLVFSNFSILWNFCLSVTKHTTSNRVWNNSPVDFHTPRKDKLFHSPSGGFFLADMSPFCLLRICNTAACRTSARTSAPSSCVQDVPLIRLSKEYKIVFFYFTAFVLLCILLKCLTLFTRNPSRRVVFFLSVSILFSVVSACSYLLRFWR